MYNFRPSTISKLRKGTVDDPYIIINEIHQIGNGKVVLSEIPEASYRVTVSGSNITWSEIRSGLPNENEYIVNYETAEVKFHNDKNGLQLEFHYKGRGLQYIDAKRVYTKVSNGDVVETLEEVAEDVKTKSNIVQEILSNNVNIVQQEEIPSGIVEGRLWLDNSQNIYQGTVFNELNVKTSALEEKTQEIESQLVKIILSPTPPEEPNINTLWYKDLDD